MIETFNDLMTAVSAVIPTATIGQDNDGQLVIYTGLKEYPGGVVAEMPPVE